MTFCGGWEKAVFSALEAGHLGVSYVCKEEEREGERYKILLYLLDGMRAAIGQFNGPYCTVQPAKSKTLFSRVLFQDKEI